jgi:hypothetical protein
MFLYISLGEGVENFSWLERRIESSFSTQGLHHPFSSRILVMLA